jgi:hypothetical protein
MNPRMLNVAALTFAWLHALSAIALGVALRG